MTIDRNNYPGIPADFPIEASPFSLPGVQIKFNAVKEGGKYFASGTAPSEIAQAYDLCEDLAQQLQAYCIRKQQTIEITSDELLEQSFQALLKKQWCTPSQSLWVVRRAAALLGWSWPACLIEMGADKPLH